MIRLAPACAARSITSRVARKGVTMPFTFWDGSPDFTVSTVRGSGVAEHLEMIRSITCLIVGGSAAGSGNAGRPNDDNPRAAAAPACLRKSRLAEGSLFIGFISCLAQSGFDTPAISQVATP